MSKRLSLTIDTADAAALELLARAGVERDALVELSEDLGLPLTDSSGEAAVLRALVRIGADAVRQRALDDGYAAIAADQREHEAERLVLRERRARRDRTRD